MFRLVKRRYVNHLAEHLLEYSDGKIYKELNPDNYPFSISGIVRGVESLRRMIRMFYVNIGASTGKVRGAVQEMNYALIKADEGVKRASAFSGMAHSIAVDIVEASASVEAGINKIRDSAAVIASSADEIHSDSLSVKTMSEEAFSAMKEATSAFDKLREASLVMAEKVNILTSTTKDIDSLLAVIQEIASQTDMLALNAAIEAARAGEYGRGFSIVADEIQKLSGEASSAADSANKLLAEVNRGINETSSFVRTGESILKSGAAAVLSGSNFISELLNKSVSIEQKAFNAKKATSEQLKSTAVIAEVSGKTASDCRSSAEYTETVTSLMSMQKTFFNEINEMGDSLNKIADDLVSAGNMISIIKSDDSKNNYISKRIEMLIPELKRFFMDFDRNTHDAREHAVKLDVLMKKNSDIEAAWTNSSDGKFIVSLPPAGIANAGGREWFVNALKGEVYVSEIYISAISKNPCITVSLPFSQNGKIYGVIGIDLKIQ